MALPLIATATLGLGFQWIQAPQVRYQAPKRSIPITAPIRHKSFFTNGTRPRIPVMGSAPITQLRLSPKEAKAFRQRENERFAKYKPKKKNAPNSRSIASEGTDRILVVYDNWGEYDFIGELYGRQLAELLSHFEIPVDLVDAKLYTSGQLNPYKATFYIGTLYDTDLPTAFRQDTQTTTKPVCWVGSNIWKIAWNEDFSERTAFADKFGFRFNGLEEGFNSVNYRGEDLSKLDTLLARTTVTDPSKAQVLATSTNYSGETLPYILKSSNFYFVADNPLSTVAYADQPGHDRTLAFCDLIHDVLQTNAPTDHKAIVRIEDVNAMADPQALRTIADILSSEGVPFVVSTIPVYRDPLGYWTGGVPVDLELDMATEVVSALKYMESKGGEIIQHGTTHQIDDLLNPYSGVSGSDWEFFRVVTNSQGANEFWGPVWGDSPEWVRARTEWGRAVLQRCGFNPKGWLTPHYMASPVDYDYFATAFEYSLCPTVNFTIDDLGYLFYQGLNAPYPTKDSRNAVHLPETISYISPGTPNMDPATLALRARKLKVVRDGWAGMFFHPFLDPELLRQAVVGVKAQGFTFVKPDRIYGPK